MRRILLLLLAISLFLNSEDTTRITRSYNVRTEDLPSLQNALQSAITAQGKIIPIPKNSKIIVQDIPTQFGLIEEIVQGFNDPQPNVRIEIISKSFGNGIQRHASLEGQTTIGGVRVGNRDRKGIEVNLGNQSITNDSLNSSFLVVRSGGSATLEVGKNVPVIDYFWTYARGLGLVSETQTRWEKLGTSLAIRPRVIGNQIEVDVIPTIRKINRDFFDPEETISFENLKTSVIVANGSSIQIGGIASGDATFQKYFFGFNQKETSRNTDITLIASIIR